MGSVPLVSDDIITMSWCLGDH